MFVRSPKRLQALQALDFVQFALYYNGKGQEQTYGKLISDRFEAFRRLRPG